MKWLRCFCALLLCLAALPALAQNVVFRGTPTVRVFASASADGREKVDADAAAKAECVVVQRGKKFFWASRENVPLIRTDTPQFTYFVHAESGGYVKVFTGERKAANAPADYIEHINKGFETITYWGWVTGYQAH